MKPTRKRLIKEPSKNYLRNKADRLLQEYIKSKYPNCLVCYKPTNCGHHFFTKKSSNALRYYLPNIIPLCLSCHCKVHTQPHLVNPAICYFKGEKWYKDLVEVKSRGIKENLDWYKTNIQELEAKLKKLKEEKNDTL